MSVYTRKTAIFFLLLLLFLGVMLYALKPLHRAFENFLPHSKSIKPTMVAQRLAIYKKLNRSKSFLESVVVGLKP